MIKDIKELNFPAYATLETASATIADMGDRTITSQVKIAGNVVPDFSYDWEVEFKGERYIHPVKTPQGTKDNASRKAKIDMTFRHWAIHEMKRQYFVEMASTTAGTAIADKYIASLGLNLGDFVTAFNLVLNHYFGGRIVIRLNPEWQYDTEAKLVSISYSYIWDVLQQMYEIYGVRWTLKTNADGVCEILMGYPTEEVSHIFEYGFEGGLLSVQRQVQSTEIRNRLLGRGGEKNLPYRYFKDKDPNNPLFEADPDWIPELANIAFTELRGKTFRDYVRGWKARRYGGTPMAEPTEAYLAGYNAEKFDPIEYVDDKESIEKYGVLVGALKNNEEIYPSIQGAPGDVDMIVDAEQVTDDDVDAAVENDSVTTNLESGHQTYRNAPANSTITIETLTKRHFSVPAGKVGNLDMSLTVTGKYSNVGDYEPTYPILKTETVNITVHDSNTDEIVKSSVAPVVNLPAGDYYYMITADVETNYDKESMVTLNIESVRLYVSTPGVEGWSQTFDIWVRNIWGSERNAGETDQQYADRVWLPILGDRMGDEARVVFASGWLSFSSDWEFPIVGYAFDDSKDGSEWRLTLAKSEAELEASGKYIPYEGYNASAGDRFFFIGIDMPWQYVYWGEERIDDYKRDTLPETARINPSWVIKTDKVRLNQNREGAKLIDSLSVGAQIRLASKQFISGAYESLYVQSMTYNWTADTILYPDVEVVVSDKVSTVKNPVAQMQGSIETLQRQVGSLSNIQQIIRQVCDQLYLRKDGVEDLSKSPTRFLGKVTGEKFRQGQIGGRDWGIYRDENGNAIFEADKLVARQGILVSDLVVNEATYVGGLQINSAAAMKVTAVEETDDGYVCYFDQQQGSVTNKFKVDDVALCQKFDPEDNEIKFYKRRVIAIADASVTLSKTDVNGGGVPSVDDEIIHYGNYTDGTRQFVIIRDVIGGGYERMLMGLDSVNSDGVEYYFAGKSADSKARWFVGDDEQYAKYEDGQFTIKGNLFVTGSDKPISYITEALGDGAGGLILGTAIIVGYNDDEGTFVPMAGMSGVFDESRDDGGAAAWYGGVLGDAKIVFNMDGSGYLADGNIRWDKKGAVTFSDKIKISTEGDETLGSILSMLAVFNDMFYFYDENTICTKYNFFSEGQNAAGGIGEEEGESGGSTATIVVDTAMSDTSDNAVANKVIKAYVDSADEEIEQRLLALEESGTGGGGTVEITKDAIIDALEYTPANENDIPTRVGQLANDMGYLVNAPGDPYATIQNVRNLLSYYVRAEEMDTAMSDTSTNAVQNKAIKAYVDNTINDIKTNPQTYIQLKTINGMEIYGEGNIAIEGGSSEGTSGLAAINVNSQSFQPDSNGIVTLPNYRPLDNYNQDLAEKVDKVDGKGLSTNDYTTADKNKLAGIAAGAEVNVQSDWNATSGDAFIKNKPTLSVVATSGSYSDLINTPRFAPVATSGSYNDLLDKPTIPVEVTETTVAGWGFTKNTGTYIKPSTGIPKSHLANGVQTSLGLADTALQPSALNNYPTTTEVSNALTEALKNYALAQDLTQVDERLADVEAFFDSKDDTDSLVNKWHEIVDFLDATEGDTLDSILSTYAKDADLESAVKRIAANEATINTHTTQISNHATRLSVVETKATNNATAITNIQKLFTDGKANKAITDGNGNNIVSTYATKTALAATDVNVTTNATAISTLKATSITAGTGLTGTIKLDGTGTFALATVGTAGTYYKVTTDAYGRVKSGVKTLEISDVTGLSTRLSGIDTTVAGHTTSIATLQGYFTNGKANNADKLDGYDSSYFATAANLNSLVTRVTTAEGEIDGLQEDNETFMAWYNAVGKYFKYDSVNEAWYLDGDFYATGQNAAGGIGEEEGSTGDGLDEDQLADYLTTNKYVTQTWITANLGALASKNSLAFSELTSKPTTLSGYGITDGMHWIANMDKADTTYFRHAGYGYPAGGWNGVGPAIAFGISTYYAQIQAGNDTNTPYMFFRPTSNGVTGETWFRFLFDVGNSNIDSERFSCRGDLVLHRNTADGSTFVNYGPYTNDSAVLNLYGRVIELYTTDGVLIGGSKVLTESSGDGRYFPLTGDKTITGHVRIESGLTVTGTMYLKGGLFDVPAIYGPHESDYKKWRLFYHTGNDTMYIQAGKNSGSSTDPLKGNISFSGYGGQALNLLCFSSDYTFFLGKYTYFRGTEEAVFSAKSTTINGTLAVNNHTDINSSMAVDAWLSVDGEIKGKAISNPTNAAVTNQWRIIRADDALYLQVGTDAGETNGTLHLTGYSGTTANLISLKATTTHASGAIEVEGTSWLRGATRVDSGISITDGGLKVESGVSSFVGHTTFSDGITVDGEQAILGPIPSGGTYPRFRVFPHSSGFYFQAATYDGTSREGIVQFSGMQGVNAAEVYFRSNSTMFTGSLKVDGQVGTFSQIVGLHSTGAYHRYRITQNSVGTFFQAGVNDGSKQQGTMYLSGIDNTVMAELHLRSDKTKVYGSMEIPNAPLTLGSTLSVSGQATLSGGAFLPPSKTILFQDAATETFTISFDSGVGGLNLSGATRTLGLASFQKGIQIEHGQSIAFVDKDGVKQYITLDEENGAIKVIGNFFATGQNAAGGAGGEELGMLTSWENVPTNLEGVTLSASLGIDLYNNSKKVLTSWDDIPEEGDEGYEDFVLSEYTVSADLVQTMNNKITELESMGGGAENILIKVNALSTYDGRTITTGAMQILTGLTVDIANKMLQGAYNKVIDNSGDYPEVWDYTARGTSTGIIVYLRIGDGYDMNTAYALTYTQSVANWSIIMGEI